MHWAWSVIVDARKFKKFTDGKPGAARRVHAERRLRCRPPAGRRGRPVHQGLAQHDRQEEGRRVRADRHTSIIFWEMTSYGKDDATFPILNNYRHGGNGAIFFGG